MINIDELIFRLNLLLELQRNRNYVVRVLGRFKDDSTVTEQEEKYIIIAELRNGLTDSIEYGAACDDIPASLQHHEIFTVTISGLRVTPIRIPRIQICACVLITSAPGGVNGLLLLVTFQR
ncbi:hypothetical protein OUZ56_014707 [Daphnia magna]|uniref:Uncharacterized protein n=1 Tax=Daphnia magna TaxID=35525 RepID=A0ABR0AKK2_9CRUS|nr:hypothetical protein OUZ56_014707 [Daphnia magna]